MGEGGDFLAEVVEDFSARESDGEGEAAAPLDEDGDSAVSLGDGDMVGVEGDGCGGREVFHRIPASRKEK